MSTTARHQEPTPSGRGPFRRPRRSQRVAVDLQARIADSPTIVEVRNLTPEGLAFDSPVRIELGTRVVLLTRIGTADGTRRDIALPVVTRWTRHGHHVEHIGAEFAGVDDATRALLTEYCAEVASSRRRHAEA